MYTNPLLKFIFVVAAVFLQAGNMFADADKDHSSIVSFEPVCPDYLKTALLVDDSIKVQDVEAIPLEVQIDKLLDDELYIARLEDELNEVSKQTTWSWKNRPSLKKIFTWTKGALARLVATRKREMTTVAVGSVFVVLGAIFLYTISDGGQINLADLAPLLPQRLVISIPKNMGRVFFITLCHEVGHALMNYAMNGHASDIYLGESPEGEFLGILPGVQLGSLDPYSPARIKANIADMISLPAEEAFAIKKSVLLELATREGPCGRNLEELKNSSEYADCVAAMTHDALAGNRKKIAAFYMAGPAAALTSIAVFKVLSGESLSALNNKDIEELFNVLPWSNSDGFNIISRGLGRPDIAMRAQQIVEKILPFAYCAGTIGYTGKILHACNAFNKFPNSGHNVVSMIGNTLRALGIAAINIGSLGMIYVEPVAVAE